MLLVTRILYVRSIQVKFLLVYSLAWSREPMIIASTFNTLIYGSDVADVNCDFLCDFLLSFWGAGSKRALAGWEGQALV